MSALEDRVILLDPQMALATVTEFLDEIRHQWLHYGPEGPDGRPRNAGQQQATAINRMLEALDVNDVRNYPSRASSPGEVPTIKVEGQPSQGVPVTPKRKNDVFDVGRKASTGAETRRSGLTPRMPNRPAYLSG